MPTINGERLLGDLRRIADFGRYQTGVHRPHLSPQDVESRHWLAARMKEAGLEPVIDGIGTVIGKSPKTGPRILIGSHSDTQPRGGWLDGVMGVIYGLEVARALAEDPETAHLAVDVASWADEEGHWGQMTGSRSFIGIFSEADIDKAGRILIPPMLREHADLQKEVLWAGMGKTAELWSRERWKKAQEMSDTDLSSFKAAISEHFRL